MNIGTLAKETGLAQSRSRYYEAMGLLGPVKRNANGYRVFARETSQVLEIIAIAQEAGFSLGEIRNLLPQRAAGWDLAKLVESLKGKLADIETLQAKLARKHGDLAALIVHIEREGHGGDCFNNAEAALASLRGSHR